MTNLASATGSFNGQTITSPQNILIVRYKQPTNDRDNNGESGGAVAPVVPISPVPMVSASPIYGSEPNGYGNELYGPIEIQNLKSNGYRLKLI